MSLKLIEFYLNHFLKVGWLIVDVLYLINIYGAKVLSLLTLNLTLS